tara:strand:- start:333 stop:1202 length:870 start_codon:yes stop_codon:yes gene_type:complete
MSEIRVNELKNEAATGAPSFPVGIVTISDTTQSTSSTDGALVVSGGVGIAKSLNVGGNVTVGGTLTYEDVTNVDVLGIATYRSSVQFGASGVGGTITAAGHAAFENGLNVAGVATATQFVGILTGGTSSGASVGVGTTSTIMGVTDGATQNSFSGILKEKASIQSTNVANAVGTIDLAQGNVHYFTTNGSGATTADIIYKGGNNVSGFMTTGDNVSVSIITKPNNSEYINAVTIDGAAVTEEWSGGSTPSSASGAASSYTITTVNITRIDQSGTPNTDYLVLCSVTNYA